MVFTFKKTTKSKCTTAAILLLSSLGYADFAKADEHCLDIQQSFPGQGQGDPNFAEGCMASSQSSFLLQIELNQLRSQHNQVNRFRRNAMLTNNNSVASTVFPFQIDGVAGGSDSGFKQLSFYLTADSHDGKGEKTGSALGFDFKGNTLLLGLDLQFSDSLFIGTSFSVIDTESDFEIVGPQSAGSRDVDTKTLAINVAKYWNDNWALQTQLSFSEHELDTVRNFFGSRFLASTNSDNQALLTELVYTKNVEGWRVAPSLGFSYLSGEIDGYQETLDIDGGTGQAVNLATQDFRSLSADLSVQIDRAFLLDWGVLIPSIRISLNNEFDDDDNRANVTLLISSVTAPVGDEKDKLTATFDLGVSGQFTHGWSGFASYRQLTGHQYLTHKTFSLGVRREF